MPDIAGLIDGALVAGEGAELAVQDPSTEEVFARFAGASSGQVEAAIMAARRAFDAGEWAGLPAAQRVATLTRFIAALADRSDSLIETIMREAGCPRHGHSMAMQVAGPLKQMGEVMELFLTLPQAHENPLPLQQRITPSGTVLQSHMRYTPIGVVSAIAAYNYPLLLALWKVIPALVTGNTVVLRPSPLTPLSALIMAEVAVAAQLPPGVLNIVADAGHAGGTLMTSHPAVDMIGFTGSSGVGAAIMAQAAPTLKRVQLELGGKSAQIFLPDSIGMVAPMAIGMCSAHAGQGCAIGTRMLVPESSKAEIAAQLAQLLPKVRVGPADDTETQLGPVISAAQRDRCEQFVAAALDHGGSVIGGGKRPAHLPKGFYFEATVLDLPDNANPAAQEEVFGPVLGLIGYRDLDHAVEMANDSKFGLSGYVHGKDKALALETGLRIRSGTVNVNAGMMSAYISSGGHRMSGIGRERGVEGLRVYQQQSVLNLGG